MIYRVSSILIEIWIFFIQELFPSYKFIFLKSFDDSTEISLTDILWFEKSNLASPFCSVLFCCHLYLTKIMSDPLPFPFPPSPLFSPHFISSHPFLILIHITFFPSPSFINLLSSLFSLLFLFYILILYLIPFHSNPIRHKYHFHFWI